MASQLFAQVFQAYLECSEEAQAAIRDMVEIVNDPEATEDDRAMACSTIAEALFPSRHEGILGLDLEDDERLSARRSKEARKIHAEMDHEETHFVDHVQALMSERQVTQADLAEACGIGQPAVSNLLSRRSRPQRRTVEKIAKALGVHEDEIWPDRAAQR
jgi:lambda repressor-like predicted transcriptional regulator